MMANRSTPHVTIAAILMFLIFAGAAGAATPQVERMVLDNQLVVLVSEQHDLPFVTFELLIDAGSRRDPERLGGVANLTSEAILLGTQSQSLAEINQKLDFLGASLSTDCGRDFMTVSFRSLKKNLDKSLPLFEDVVLHPKFPEKQIGRKIQEIKGGIESEKDQPMQVAEKDFMKLLFRENPYGHPVEGDPQSLSRMKKDDVVRFYDRYFRPNQAVLAVVGDVTLEEVQSKILSNLKKWPAKEIPEEKVGDVFAASPQPVRIDKPVSQANIILGHAGIARANKDYYAVSVMNQILGGGGFTSRLLREIRVKRGLAYSVESFFDPRKYPGSFQIVLQTKNSSAKEAIDLAIREMRTMREQPPEKAAVSTAKNYLVGSFPMRYDSQSELADYLVQIEYYGLGLDYFEKYPSYIEAVGESDVFNAAKQYLHPDRIVSSIVADMEKAGLK